MSHRLPDITYTFSAKILRKYSIENECLSEPRIVDLLEYLFSPDKGCPAETAEGKHLPSRM